MRYEINLGTLTTARRSGPPKRLGQKFRIAVLGDFSARANRGELAVGEELAARKPLRVDCDNLDEVLARHELKLRLPLHGPDGAVEVAIESMDDFHPDQLYGKLEIFSELAGLRSRLKNKSTFSKAAQEVQSWVSAGDSGAPTPSKSRAAAVPIDGTLQDFQRLIGREHAAPPEASPVDELLRRAVGPHIVQAKDPKQDAVVASVDEALSGTMRAVLHHPDFQAAESLWRSVDFLVRRLETDTELQIVLLDITAEELAADLSQGDDLAATGLYKLLVEKPAMDAHEGPYAAVIGNYVFEHTPPHAELLGRLARIVAEVPVPFITAIGSGCLDQKETDIHPLVQEAWSGLGARPEAGCLGVTLPRFLLRLPYGERTDPIDSFDFEEFVPKSGVRGMLWGNSAVMAGLLLGLSFTKDGAKMQPGSVLQVDDLPLYYYNDADGDQVALPCTERLITTRTATEMTRRGFMPVLAIKGSPEARLAGFRSVGGGDLRGFWNPPAPAPAETAPAAASAESAPAPAEAGTEAGEEAAAAPAASGAGGGDAELDALLSSIGGDETPAAADGAEGGAGAAAASIDAAPSGEDAELAALLASLQEEDTAKDTAAASGDMDPELEKLLKDLG